MPQLPKRGRWVIWGTRLIFKGCEIIPRAPRLQVTSQEALFAQRELGLFNLLQFISLLLLLLFCSIY